MEQLCEEIENFYQVVLDVISENMSSFIKRSKYGAINTTDTSKMGYYVINFMSEPYTLQEEKTCDERIGTAVEIVVKA